MPWLPSCWLTETKDSEMWEKLNKNKKLISCWLTSMFTVRPHHCKYDQCNAVDEESPLNVQTHLVNYTLGWTTQDVQPKHSMDNLLCWDQIYPVHFWPAFAFPIGVVYRWSGCAGTLTMWVMPVSQSPQALLTTVMLSHVSYQPPCDQLFPSCSQETASLLKGESISPEQQGELLKHPHLSYWCVFKVVIMDIKMSV